MMPLGRCSGYVGAVSLICTLIVLNIFLVMSGVVQEKKDKVMLFILSLPVSTTQYMLAKVVANAIAFRRAVAGADRSRRSRSSMSRRLPNGVLPFWLAVLGYMLFYYCVLLGVALVCGFRPAGTRRRSRRQHLGQLLDPVPARGCRRSAAHAQGPTRRLDRRHRRHPWRSSSSRAVVGTRSSAVYVRSRNRGLRLEEHVCPLTDRLHALDAVRAFALLLGVVFHAGFSFIPGMIPGIWAIVDNSPSMAIGVLLFIAHIFRMSLFFFIAGFFARMMFERKGARGFWSNRAKRILVPLVAGWVVLFPAIAAVWIWGLTRTFGGRSRRARGTAAAAAARRVPADAPVVSLLPAGALRRSCWRAAPSSSGSIGAAASVRRGPMVAGSSAAARRLSLLAVPVCVALYFRAELDRSWFGIPTPDRSLIPELASLVGFGTAFAFGWLVHRQIDLLQAWTARSGRCISPCALGRHRRLPLDRRTRRRRSCPRHRGVEKLAFAFCYALAIWCWSFALIGLAMRFLAHANARVRYVADASYWIYLVHLPVVAAIRSSWASCRGTGASSFRSSRRELRGAFVSYHYLVRSTFIGQLLNGRRYPRASRGRPPAHVQQIGSISDRRRAPAIADPAADRAGRVAAPACTSATARPWRSPASISTSGAASCSRCSVRTAPASRRRSALWLGLLEPDAGSVAASAARRSTRQPPARRRDDAGGRADAGAARARAHRSDRELLPGTAADRETRSR